MASVELALILPVLAALCLGVVEGSVALKSYYTLLEASREGARLVLRDGLSADVASLVRSMAPDLADAVTTKVTQDSSKNVTVEVDYDYSKSGSGFSTLLASGDGSSTVFKARTIMAMP
jgi:Flp pilus assembly protein TadG